MDAYQNLEEKTKEIGREIYTSIEGQVPSVFDTGRWKGKMMEWSMKDETFKIQLFRFVDALPSLNSDQLAVRLLKEYFTEDVGAPALIRNGIKALGRRGVVPMIAGRLIRKNIESLARQFIAGKDPKDALSALTALREEGFSFSIDLLGEAVLSDKESKEYADRYLDLLNFLHPEVLNWPDNPLLDCDHMGNIPRLNISLKVSSFYSQLNPIDWEGSIENTKKGLRPILRKAMEQSASVTFDMESYYYKDLTIAIFKSILEEEEFKEFPFAGIALQSYLKDSKEDLSGIIGWAEKNKRRITIRLVKGAYWDYETIINRQKGWPVPVFLNKEETDRSFEEQTKMLLGNSERVRPAFATHNLRSISYAVSVAESLQLPKEAYEFQMLYGMAEPIRQTLRKMNYRINLYAPVGELLPGMAYLVRRLLENTSNESFLRKSFAEKTPFEELIKPPGPLKKSATEADSVSGQAFQNEPPADFSKEMNREKMKKALDKVKKEMGQKYPLYIGGREVRKEDHENSINPARPDEIIGKVSFASKEDAGSAIREARKAWDTWKRTSFKERANILIKAAKEIRRMRFELSALEVFEVGKTWQEADGDIIEAVDFLEYYAGEMIRLGTMKRLGDYAGEDNTYGYESKGVGVVIAPWNFPLAISAGMVSAGIVTGNAVIFKPSEQSSIIGWRLVEAFRKAGLPPGVLQFLPGRGEEIGEYLVTHPDIDFIAFTGSKDVGLRIVRLAGETVSGQRNIKKVIAEMGGKNAIIVDETADMDEAVKGVLDSALGYQGQKCSACSRVIFIGERFSEFCSRLKEAMESIRIGLPEDPASFMGPVVDREAYQKIKYYIEEVGGKEGKTLLKRVIDTPGYFIGPAVFEDVKPDSPLVQEEIFGPVLALIRAKDIDEAVSIANKTPYALTGGLFSRSPANIRKVKEGLDVGNLYINRKITGAIVGRQPFGGFKMSGVGSKAGGPDYLIQFLNPRSISENTLRKGFAPFEPPPE
jgi:RHH-type transcriptional regulator, proline utilization regulon repressor / proline dehydrogenase / delta 1-pyrroline-5-carboxylate dehydrogenase